MQTEYANGLYTAVLQELEDGKNTHVVKCYHDGVLKFTHHGNKAETTNSAEMWCAYPGLHD